MNDKQFMTIFLGVMGVLTIIFFVIFFIAQIIVPEKIASDEFTTNNVVSRLEPVGKLNYSGSNEITENLEVSSADAVRELRCDSNSNNTIHTVKMLNEGSQGSMVFEPAFIKINTCDSIKFEMTDAGHNAVTVAAPKDSIPFDTKYKPTHTVQFDTDGIYLYQCAPHAMMAMAGLIQVSDANNKDQMKAEIEKFEGTVMMPNVKTRMSDLFNANIK
jgi:pseudoazurin